MFSKGKAGKSGFGTKKRNERIFLACLFLLPIIHKITFYIGGNLTSFTLAFQQYDGTNYIFVGFKNFIEVFNDLQHSELLRAGFANTVYLYIMETFLSIPISLLCSYFVVKKVPGHDFLKVVFFLPGIVSGVVMTLMYGYFCEYAIPGILNKVFGVKNFPLILVEYPYAFPMMMLYSLWVGFAGGIVMYVGSMSRVPDGVTDAAQIDGVTVMQEFWHVTMPTVYPMLTVFLITGLTGLFMGGGPMFTFYQYSAPTYCYTVGYFLFKKTYGALASPYTYPYPAAVGMIVTLIAAPLTFLLKYCLERFGPSEG